MNTNIGSDTNVGSQTDYVSRDKYGMYSSDNDNKGPGPTLMGADTLLGNSVYNSEEEDLGTIKEFMIEMASGKIAYAVLSYGGFLGMGDKLFAVPWDALELDTVNHRFVLDIDKETLKSAPGFDKDHWPSMADRTWAIQVHEFYGTTYRPSDDASYDDESGTSGTYGSSERDDLRTPGTSGNYGSGKRDDLRSQ